jgi:ribosomal protein S15P/S13E
MNFANHLAERVKKTSNNSESKFLKTINATKDIEIQIGVSKQVNTLLPNQLPIVKSDNRTVEEQIKSLTSKINKLKQSQLQSKDNSSTIEAINQQISTLVTNHASTDQTPRVGLVINEKLNFKIEKLKTNKLQLQKVIKSGKVVTKAFFTTIDESMFIEGYVPPELSLEYVEPKQEILIPIKAELVNTIIYHTNIDEMYGYHVLEQNNIINESLANKKSLMAKSANIWTGWKNKMGMNSFSLREVKRR